MNFNCWVNTQTAWPQGAAYDLDPFDKVGLNCIYQGLLTAWERTPEELAQRWEMAQPQEGSFFYAAARACVHRLVQPQNPMSTLDLENLRDTGETVAWDGI